MAWRNINDIIEEQHQAEIDRNVAVYYKHCREIYDSKRDKYIDLDDFETYDDNMKVIANRYKLRDTEVLKKFKEKQEKLKKLNDDTAPAKEWDDKTSYQRSYRKREKDNIYLIKMLYRARKNAEKFRENKEKFEKYSKKVEELLELKKDNLTKMQARRLLQLHILNSTK